MKLRNRSMAVLFATCLVSASAASALIICPDDDPGAAPVVALGAGLARRLFGPAGALGHSLTINGVPHAVVGVMPAGFDYPRGAQLWTTIVPMVAAIPKTSNPDPLRNIGMFYLVARLNAGVTPRLAADQWTRINAKLLENSPGPRYDISATPFLDHTVGPARQAM